MQKYIAEYLRLSLEDGDICLENEKEESDSISHQRAIIKQYKLEHGLLELPAMEFVDDGYSGTNFNRPEITHLLDTIRQGNISCLIVKDISRFGRNYLEVGDYLEQVFPFLGVRFISINDNYDSNDYVGTTGGIEIAFKSMLYDMYSKDLSVKMRSSLEVRRKHGDYISPRPPFGYAFSKESKRKLVIDPMASQYVYKIFELAGLGHTTGIIARKLNDEGVPTPAMYKNISSKKRHYKILDKTGYWNAKMIRGIIKNKVYIGMVVNKKSQVIEVGGKQFRNVPEEEQICVPDMHEPIITEQMFRDANRIIKGREKGDLQKRKRK
ncbi:MAG: recombinase family protein, partial [Anaerovoracaceae bacterium]